MKKKFISILLSLSVVVTTAVTAFGAPSDIPFDKRPFTADSSAVETAIEEFKSELNKKGSFENVLADYSVLMDLYADVVDIQIINNAELWKINSDVKSGYTSEMIDKNYDEALKLAKDIELAVKSALDSPYSDKFREYWGKERTAYVENIESEIDDTDKQLYDRYNELLDNEADGTEFVALLREVIENAKTDEDGSSKSGEKRGYTVEQMYNYCQNIASQYYYYVNKFKNYGAYLGISKIKDMKPIDDPIKTLSFVEKIDPSLKTAYEYMIKNGLCFCESKPNYMGVTFPFITYGDAEVIVSNEYDAIGTLIHEFGHFQRNLGAEYDSEKVFFGGDGEDYYPLTEFDSQMFELIAMDYYDEIYGENADAMRFNSLVNNFQGLGAAAQYTALELMLYNTDLSEMSDEALDEYLTGYGGEEWYINLSQFFTMPGNYIKYSLMMFDAIQLYDEYINDRSAGLKKYFDACELSGMTYGEATKELGLISAFDENAGEVLEKATDDIFKTLYDMDYATALDYFENGTYLGKVFPTRQRVSVNGGAPKTLYAYNSSGYNYIKIRDLAVLLDDTSARFDVEYDAQTNVVNMLTGRKYTPDGTETTAVSEVETAGQKAAGTYDLLRDGEQIGFGRMIFVNGHNCFMLRGLAENGVLDIDVDYDADNDIVLITTK